MTVHTKALHRIADGAVSRVGGAPLIYGNRVRLLRDARENYPAWLEAIRGAKKWIHFESYIIHDDEAGEHFAEALAAKVREGVRVRLIYDWVGSIGNASNRFWRKLQRSGIDVRCFNPPRIESPFGWVSRDHRKMIGVDGRIAYVTGLCVGSSWIGHPDRGVDGWRDTGVEIEGPAVVEVERAFASIWAASGDPLPDTEIPGKRDGVQAGDAALRIVASVPYTGSIYRLDQLLASLAQHRIWLSDAYFIGTSAYVQALRNAALAGIDVRLLIPAAYDVPGMRALSRSGLRPLLEAGVRIFEWNGSMMHAKTAVIDGHWARVGSTNLNVTSWITNWELDVVVESRQFAKSMEDMFLEDLSRSTEIVLSRAHRSRRPKPVAQTPDRKNRRLSATQTAANVVRLGHTVSAALTNRRELGPAEAVIMVWTAIFLSLFSGAALLWPRAVVLPVVVMSVWISVTLLVRAYRLRGNARTFATKRKIA